MTEREEPLPPEPPPVPVNHPAGRLKVREAIELPTRFYFEMSGALVALYLLHFLFRRFFPPMASSVVLVLGVFSLLFSLFRLLKGLLRTRKREKPPALATLSFLLALFLPGSLISWSLYTYRDQWSEKNLPYAEAEKLLRQSFQSQKMFFRDYGFYTYNIKEIGIDRPANSSYILGFPEACTIKFSVNGARHSWEISDFSFSQGEKREIESTFRSLRRAEDCPDPKMGFEIYAMTFLKKRGLDIWRIDSSGKLLHLEKEK